MRTLTGTLTTAQKTLSARPALYVALKNKLASDVRLAWDQLYAGSEADSYHAAVCPGDNLLVRVRTDGTVLYFQRIATPSAGSDYTAWTQISALLITGKGVALAALGAKVALFYVADNLGVRTLYCRESTDYGATWGSAVQVQGAGVATDWEHLAACYLSADVLLLFYTKGANSETLYRIKRTTGTWGSEAAWSNTASAITGIGCSFVTGNDVNLLIAGKDSDLNYLLWDCVYGQGVRQTDDTYSALQVMRKTNVGSQVSYEYPSIAYADVFRESFRESFTGTKTYQRVMGLHSMTAANFFDNLHHGDYPHPTLAGSYGYAIAANATHVFLSTSKGLWWAPLAVTTVDVTSKLISLMQRVRPWGGSLDFTLDNSAGTYNTPSFDRGWQVDFRPGFYSTAGAEYSSGQLYFVESWEHVTGGGKAFLAVRCIDAWGLLARAQARRAYEFNVSSSEKTYKQLVEHILALGGLSLTVVSSSSPYTGEYPRLSIYSGQSYLAILKSLYQKLSDVLYLRGTEARNFNPGQGEASGYSYGVTGSAHPIHSARYGAASLDANWFQVQGGSNIYVDEFTQGILLSEIYKNYARFEPFKDSNANTQGKAEGIASALDIKEEHKRHGGEININVNCGQELYDVVDITDAGAGLSAAKRRVFAIETLYETSKGKYAMQLALGGT